MTENLTKLIICLSLWVLGAIPGAAQSLFPGQGAAVPLISAPKAPLFADHPGMSAARGPSPLIEARALPLVQGAGAIYRRYTPTPGYQPPSRGVLEQEMRALHNKPPRSFAQQTDLICIAVSIYHEARNQPRAGQAAVATVILNRAANPSRWGLTPCEVVVPVQFSYLRPDRSFARIRNKRSWNEAVEIAAEVLLAGPDPALQGSDHYHATYVDPPWNRAMDLVVRIEDHIFWRSRPKSPERS